MVRRLIILALIVIVLYVIRALRGPWFPMIG